MDDNPPAFPNSVQPDFQFAEPGMTLRDWFAGQALAGLCANSAMFDWNGPITKVRTYESWAVDIATAIADAMLAERQREGA